MLFIAKIESNEFNLDLITLKSGKVLGIDSEQVALYSSMKDFNEFRTIDRQSIDLSKEFNDYFPDQAELSNDVIEHYLKMHDLQVSDLLISFARSIYAECKINQSISK